MASEQLFHVGIKALIINDKKEILVLKTNPAELKQVKGGVQVHWDLPGGRIKSGDSVEDTLRKEIEEELGIDSSSVIINDIFDASVANLKIPVEGSEVCLLLMTYLCRLTTSKKFRLSFEHTEYKWVPVNEAKHLLGVKFSSEFISKLEKLII